MDTSSSSFRIRTFFCLDKMNYFPFFSFFPIYYSGWLATAEKRFCIGWTFLLIFSSYLWYYLDTRETYPLFTVKYTRADLKLYSIPRSELKTRLNCARTLLSMWLKRKLTFVVCCSDDARTCVVRQCSYMMKTFRVAEAYSLVVTIFTFDSCLLFVVPLSWSHDDVALGIGKLFFNFFLWQSNRLICCMTLENLPEED